MHVAQEPKYTTDQEGRIINRATGQAIPDDEPVFIFRARDIHAVKALHAYLDACNDPAHIMAISARIVHFQEFQAAHPDRMKEPDSPG